MTILGTVKCRCLLALRVHKAGAGGPSRRSSGAVSSPPCNWSGAKVARCGEPAHTAAHPPSSAHGPAVLQVARSPRPQRRHRPGRHRRPLRCTPWRWPLWPSYGRPPNKAADSGGRARAKRGKVGELLPPNFAEHALHRACSMQTRGRRIACGPRDRSHRRLAGCAIDLHVLPSGSRQLES